MQYWPNWPPYEGQDGPLPRVISKSEFQVIKDLKEKIKQKSQERLRVLLCTVEELRKPKGIKYF